MANSPTRLWRAGEDSGRDLGTGTVVNSEVFALGASPNSFFSGAHRCSHRPTTNPAVTRITADKNFLIGPVLRFSKRECEETRTGLPTSSEFADIAKLLLSFHFPALGVASGITPELHERAIHGAGVFHIKATAGGALWLELVETSSHIDDFPLLSGTRVVGPNLDFCAIGCARAAHIQGLGRRMKRNQFVVAAADIRDRVFLIVSIQPIPDFHLRPISGPVARDVETTRLRNLGSQPVNRSRNNAPATSGRGRKS
jgi:hypothetical protein